MAGGICSCMVTPFVAAPILPRARHGKEQSALRRCVPAAQVKWEVFPTLRPATSRLRRGRQQSRHPEASPPRWAAADRRPSATGIRSDRSSTSGLCRLVSLRTTAQHACERAPGAGVHHTNGEAAFKGSRGPVVSGLYAHVSEMLQMAPTQCEASSQLERDFTNWTNSCQRQPTLRKADCKSVG